MFDQITRDLSLAARLLRKERGFTIVALLIISLGVGLNTAVFSIINTVLVRPLPFNQSERLIRIFNGDTAASSRDLSLISSQVETWEALQQINHTLERIEAYNPFSFRQTSRLTDAYNPTTISSVDVSSGLFDMLGIIPHLGRLFIPEDGETHAHSRTIISYQLWRERYGADPSIVGRVIHINNQATEVVGVLPSGDAFNSVFFPALRIDAYRPIVNDDFRFSGNTLSLIGRAKLGTSIDRVRADMSLASSQIKRSHPEKDQYFSINVAPLRDWVITGLQRPLLYLWVAAASMFLIVSLNLGGLLLARNAARKKEFALRCALGAGRIRLTWQLVTECFLLVAIGSLAGTGVAWGTIRFLSTKSSVEIPMLGSLQLDSTSLGFTMLLCSITIVVCGIFPAWNTTRITDVQGTLKEEGRGSSGGPGRLRVRRILVITEVALACVLSIYAGLTVRSFFDLMRVNLGFKPENLIAIRIDPLGGGSKANYLEEILDRTRAVPGVEKAAFTDCIPFERDRSWSVFSLDRGNSDNRSWVPAHVRLVSPEFFSTMGTPLIAGRDFTRADTKEYEELVGPTGLWLGKKRSSSPGVIVINQTLATRFWPNDSALGKQVSVNGSFPCTVIGVAADVRHSGPEVISGNEIYLSLHQAEDSVSWDLMIRTPLSLSTVTAQLAHALNDLDSSIPLNNSRMMNSLVARPLSSRRMLVWLIGSFAVIALALAALGLYGVISYMVSQQTKEIGIRMALGANAATVQWDVIRKTMKLASTGLCVGLFGAISIGPVMASQIYGVVPIDMATCFIASTILMVCAFAAGYLPARRAAQIDPIVSLRSD